MIRTLPFHAMGCQMLAALDSESQQANKRLSSVPDWFEEWEQCLSRFRSDSELNQLNAHNGKPVHVSQTLWQVFQTSQQAERASNGLVTPFVLDAMLHAGYDRSFSELAERSFSELDDHQDQIFETGFSQQQPIYAGPVDLDEYSHTILLPPGVRLDFGGIAKGWAAHQTARRLHAYGPALVNAGGDIAISGSQLDGSPWAIGVVDPFQPEADLVTLMLSGGGVATSGIDYRRWQQGGQWRHHIIDPRSGQPAETDLLSVTVVGDTVMEAEMAAKVVLILGSRDGLAWLDAKPGLEGLLVLQNNQQLTTTGFDRYL